jgi:cation diffusion facilitator family transporter
MVTIARRPADDSHPYGHSKAEYLSAAFEGGMIFLAALAIFITASARLINPQPLASLSLGTAVTVLASLINLGIALLLLHGGKQHNSPALEGDGKHLMTDVWTTAGVVAGVGMAAVSGWHWLDPMVAIAVALHILHEGGGILYRAVNGLMDKALPQQRISDIEQALAQFASGKVQFSNLRTRAAATLQFAQVDMLVPPHWTVQQAHQLADDAELAIQQLGVELVVHIEPKTPD